MLTHTELAARIDDEGLRGESEGAMALERLSELAVYEFAKAKMEFPETKPWLFERRAFKRDVLRNVIQRAKDEDLFHNSEIAVSFGIESIIMYLAWQLITWLIREWLEQ